MIWIGHHCLRARSFYGIENFLIATSDNDRPDIGFHGPSPNLDNHGRTAYIQQRLSRQSG